MSKGHQNKKKRTTINCDGYKKLYQHKHTQTTNIETIKKDV
jgi:hypothetical protein